MTLIVLFGSFFAALLIGVPVAFALGISSLITVIFLELPPLIVFQRIGAGINVFALMAIPFFIFAGELMLHVGWERPWPCSWRPWCGECRDLNAVRRDFGLCCCRRIGARVYADPHHA